MLTANLSIISELREFLFSVSTNRSNLQYFCLQPQAFTRRRVLTFERMATFIVQLCKKSLKVELDEFFNSVGVAGCTKAAFSMQRVNFDPAFFYCWNRVLCDSFYKHYKSEVKNWYGFRLIACDGSNIPLVRKPELIRVFGGQSNSEGFFVQAKTFYATDILNNLVLYPQMVPYRYGELPAAYDMLNQIDFAPDMLLMFDRHYSNYKMVALLTMREHPLKYVIRVKDSLNLAQKFLRTGKREQVIDLYPTKVIRDRLKDSGIMVSGTHKIKTRLIRVELNNGKSEILMTNLSKAEGYKQKVFKNLYAKRWGVETNIGFQKNILQLEALSGHSPIAVLQDFYATVFTANLHSIITKPAQAALEKQKKKTKYPMKVNNNLAFGKLKKGIAKLLLRKSIKKILIELYEYFLQNPLPIRIGRSFPRIRKNPQSKGKHRYFTNYRPTF
jgi:hypothetical protein